MSEETWINIAVVAGAFLIALLFHFAMSFEERT
jgi:hypothetical protein